jgi:hypothetical protein
LFGNIFRGTGYSPEILDAPNHLFIELKKTVFSMLGISNTGNNIRGV